MKPKLAVTVRNEVGATSARQQKAVTRAIRATSMWMKQQIVLSFSAPKTGREVWSKGRLKRSKRKADIEAGAAVYTRGKRMLHHIASAPGEPPARDTGRLMNSIGFRMASPYVAYVGSFGVNYASALEFGSRRRKLSARPYVRPVANRANPILRSYLAKFVAEAST